MVRAKIKTRILADNIHHRYTYVLQIILAALELISSLIFTSRIRMKRHPTPRHHLCVPTVPQATRVTGWKSIWEQEAAQGLILITTHKIRTPWMLTRMSGLIMRQNWVLHPL